MTGSTVTGAVLTAGLALFMVGALAWRLDYEGPPEQALPIIHRDRRRRVWIHSWMVAALVVTPAGLAGLTVVLEKPTATVLGAMATTAYLTGAVCIIASLAFRLTVVVWAAEQTSVNGRVPDGYSAYDSWAGALYVVHMLTAYVSSAVLGCAVLASDALPRWLGWSGVVWGLVFAAGFVATRFSGPFNPPFWAHVYTGSLGIALLVS